MSKSTRKIYTSRIEKAEKIYNAVSFAREVTVDQLEEMLNMPRRTIYYHLSWLVARGYLGKKRDGIRVKYFVQKPFLVEEFVKEMKNRPPENEPLIYQEAWRVLNLIDERDLRADLIGSCKIHLYVPGHDRITKDIDVVVVREDADRLIKALREELGYKNVINLQELARMDYKLVNPVTGVGVDLYVDGIKRGSVLEWDFRKPLIEQGRLLVEHAVACKLGRGFFVRSTDGYDIAVSLPHIDIDVLTDIMKEAATRMPELIEVFYRNLETIKKHLVELAPTGYEYVSNLIKKVKESFEKKTPVSPSLKEQWESL